MSMEEMNAGESWEDDLPFTEPAPEADALWDEGEWDDSEAEAGFEEEETDETPVEDVDAGVDENADEADRQALIEAEVNRRVDQMVAEQYGDYINPYSGRPITTKAELDAYHAAFARDEEQKRLEGMGITQEMLDEAISRSPEMVQAREILQRQQQNEANNLLNQEFAALQKEFPDCGLKSAMELMQTEGGRKTLELWSKAGLSMADAYAVAHRAELKQKQNAAVKQGVLNQMNGKKHLTQTRGGGEHAEMDAATRAEYKKFFPNASDAEIAAMYAKNRKNSE